MDKITLDNQQIPLHYQIAEYITMMLKNGRLSAYEKLPPEEELRNIFSVSRTTIRHSLDHLLHEGLLYKKQGKGTFWTEKAAELVNNKKQSGINRELFNISDKTTVRMISKSREEVDPLILDLLKVPASNKVIVFRRTRYHDDKPMSFTVNYINEKYGNLLEKEHLQNQTMLEALEKIANVDIGIIQHEVEISRATTEIANELNIAVLDPVLTVHTNVFNKQSEPVETVWTYFVENAYTFKVVLEN